MSSKISKYFLPILILLISIGLAATAAYFSVTGLSKLFAGAATAIIIMASILELAKIATTAWLHNNWKHNINKAVKIWLVVAVLILMCITSMGIYGFLSNSYFITSSKLSQVDTQISLLDKEENIHNTKIINYEKVKKTKNERVESLTILRIQQENRIDSLIKKSMNGAVKRTEIQIKDANIEISKLMNDNNNIDSLIQIENSKISEIELKKAELNNNDTTAEVGPLKYIAKLTGKSMDDIINWFILVIIIVFDPLAIILLIAANISLERLRESKMSEIQKEKNIELPLTENIKTEEQPIIIVEESTIEIENNTEEKVINDIPQETELPIAKEKENVTVQLPTEIQNFFEEKNESEKEFKKMIEELNKNKTDVIEEHVIENITNTFNIFPDNSEKVKQEIIPQETVLIIENVKENENKPFEKTEAIIEETPIEETLYLKLLAILFKNGEIKLNDEIPAYHEFINDLKNSEIKYNETLIRDFLSACNLVKVIDTDKNKRIATKDYKAAREIIGKI